MNTASPELCKELYKLSGWLPEYCKWWETRGLAEQETELYDIDEVHTDSKYAFPAYDLGYLLRKLPTIYLKTKSANGYYAEIEVNNEAIFFYAGTPEDCAAKLAIELFRQGVLTHE